MMPYWSVVVNNLLAQKQKNNSDRISRNSSLNLFELTIFSSRHIKTRAHEFTEGEIIQISRNYVKISILPYIERCKL